MRRAYLPRRLSYPPASNQASLRGDRKGELVAPELNFEQTHDGAPPYQAP